MEILHGLFWNYKFDILEVALYTITQTPILEYIYVVCRSTTAYAISVYHH